MPLYGFVIHNSLNVLLLYFFLGSVMYCFWKVTWGKVTVSNNGLRWMDIVVCFTVRLTYNISMYRSMCWNLLTSPGQITSHYLYEGDAIGSSTFSINLPKIYLEILDLFFFTLFHYIVFWCVTFSQRWLFIWKITSSSIRQSKVLTLHNSLMQERYHHKRVN